MNTPQSMTYQFLSGGVMMSCFVVAMFFFRFSRRTSDRLFKMFAIAFAIMGIERIVLVFFNSPEEQRPAIYLMRLLAFGIIASAIIDKNRKS